MENGIDERTVMTETTAGTSEATTPAKREALAAASSPLPTSLSRRKALLLALASGMAVANIYYAQPLLDALSSQFGIAPSSIGIVITLTQVCYALGLLLLVPLGDLLPRTRLIAGQMLLSVLALVVVGTASSSAMLLSGIAAVGLLAVVTQTIVAFAASLAAPAERGSVVGMVTSGIVTGILLARTFAGLLTDLAGWRSVYLVSGGLTLILAFVLLRVLPHDQQVKPSSTYLQLLRSMLTLFMEERILRIRAVLALLIFTAFSILWTSLVLPLSAPPLSLSHTVIGAFGLVGAAGALSAARAGRLADRGLGQRTTGVALILLLLSWLPISRTPHSLLALGIGIVLLDLAVQAVHVTNQTLILKVRPEARSRLTAAYMLFYSIGSASGSIASTLIYHDFGWNGVCLAGAAVSAAALLFWFMTRRLD